MENLKEFMLLFRMAPSHTPPTEAQVATMHQEWQRFIGQIAAQAKLVNVSRLGFQGLVAANAQRVEHRYYVENDLAISGNLTMKAGSMEEAMETAKRCPVLLTGGTVEVRPIVPMN